MIRTARRRSGFALALAIAAMVVIGTLIGGVFFAATQEYRLGRNALLQARALTAAELGLHAAITPAPVGKWDKLVFASLPVGATAPPVELLPGDGSVDTVRITRLRDASFLVVSEGRAGSERGARARRRIASVISLAVPAIQPRGALTVRGPLDVAGPASINGADTTLAGWSCDSSSAALAGVITDDPSQVDSSACAGAGCIAGSPSLSADSVAADTNTYFRYGDVGWSDLAGSADKVLRAGSVGGTTPSYNGDGSCNVGDAGNWGDPARASSNASCQAYYPVVYAPGELRLTGGVGQGVLLVEGDLELSGGAEFFGAVVGRGRLTTSGAGGTIVGGLLVANTGALRSSVGAGSVRHSSCVLARALAGSARPRLSVGRSWNELY